jgi:hypothetical protein
MGVAVGVSAFGGLLALLAVITIYVYRSSPRLLHIALLAASYFFLLVYSIVGLGAEVTLYELGLLAACYVLGGAGLLPLLWPAWRRLVRG